MCSTSQHSSVTAAAVRLTTLCQAELFRSITISIAVLLGWRCRPAGTFTWRARTTTWTTGSRTTPWPSTHSTHIRSTIITVTLWPSTQYTHIHNTIQYTLDTYTVHTIQYWQCKCTIQLEATGELKPPSSMLPPGDLITMTKDLIQLPSLSGKESWIMIRNLHKKTTTEI